MKEENIYIKLDEDLISKLHKFPTLIENGEVSSKVLENLQYILDMDGSGVQGSPVECINIFKGMFIKKTSHYAMHGDRTEIGLIFQSYLSKSTGNHSVSYIIVDEETDKYVGVVENYSLDSNEKWTLSVAVENLGTAKEPVVKSA